MNNETVGNSCLFYLLLSLFFHYEHLSKVSFSFYYNVAIHFDQAALYTLKKNTRRMKLKKKLEIRVNIGGFKGKLSLTIIVWVYFLINFSFYFSLHSQERETKISAVAGQSRSFGAILVNQKSLIFLTSSSSSFKWPSMMMMKMEYIEWEIIKKRMKEFRKLSIESRDF